MVIPEKPDVDPRKREKKEKAGSRRATDTVRWIGQLGDHGWFILASIEGPALHGPFESYDEAHAYRGEHYETEGGQR